METGRKIAASFLGLEEGLPSESQTGEVLCELANMICGSVLSRLEGDLHFELSPPEINAAEAGSQENHTACRVLGLEEGPFAVWLDLEQAS